MEEIVQNNLETSIVCKANKQDHKKEDRPCLMYPRPLSWTQRMKL